MTNAKYWGLAGGKSGYLKNVKTTSQSVGHVGYWHPLIRGKLVEEMVESRVLSRCFHPVDLWHHCHTCQHV